MYSTITVSTGQAPWHDQSSAYPPPSFCKYICMHWNGKHLHVLQIYIMDASTRLWLTATTCIYMPWLQLKVNKSLWSYASREQVFQSLNSWQSSGSMTLDSLRDDDNLYRTRSNTRYLIMCMHWVAVVLNHDDVMCQYIAHALWSRGWRIAI